MHTLSGPKRIDAIRAGSKCRRMYAQLLRAKTGDSSQVWKAYPRSRKCRGSQKLNTVGFVRVSDRNKTGGCSHTPSSQSSMFEYIAPATRMRRSIRSGREKPGLHRRDALVVKR